MCGPTITPNWRGRGGCSPRGVSRDTLTTLLPGARWCGDCLQIDSPQERTIRLGGRGLVVTPTAFWTGPPLLGELPDQPVLLAYPAPTTLNLRVGTESDSLAAILGTTRAAVLRLLAVEHTTGDIARRLGISAASASRACCQALRAARLIDSRRDGKAVVHHVTVLGLDLIGANTGDRRPVLRCAGSGRDRGGRSAAPNQMLSIVCSDSRSYGSGCGESVAQAM